MASSVACSVVMVMVALAAVAVSLLSMAVGLPSMALVARFHPEGHNKIVRGFGAGTKDFVMIFKSQNLNPKPHHRLVLLLYRLR